MPSEPSCRPTYDFLSCTIFPESYSASLLLFISQEGLLLRKIRCKNQKQTSYIPKPWREPVELVLGTWASTGLASLIGLPVLGINCMTKGHGVQVFAFLHRHVHPFHESGYSLLKNMGSPWQMQRCNHQKNWGLNTLFRKFQMTIFLSPQHFDETIPSPPSIIANERSAVNLLDSPR